MEEIEVRGVEQAGPRRKLLDHVLRTSWSPAKPVGDSPIDWEIEALHKSVLQSMWQVHLELQLQDVMLADCD
jgi:hypothetical protein